MYKEGTDPTRIKREPIGPLYRSNPTLIQEQSRPYTGEIPPLYREKPIGPLYRGSYAVPHLHRENPKDGCLRRDPLNPTCIRENTI